MNEYQNTYTLSFGHITLVGQANNTISRADLLKTVQERMSDFQRDIDEALALELQQNKPC